jgi:hypothetical protein
MYMKEYFTLRMIIIYFLFLIVIINNYTEIFGAYSGYVTFITLVAPFIIIFHGFGILKL